MRRENWRLVNELLLQALEQEPDERSGFLATACPSDAVRREVESLLDSDPEILDTVDRPAFDLLGSDPEDFSPGERIGPYKVLRELGRGGTGAVYLAVRADGGRRRAVAVKVLKRGMDSDDVVLRFRRERRILSNLQHPNIAELYDGGTTRDHRLYFVMEYVEGQPIDRFCDAHAVDVDQRLELFLKVCAAVQFAHQNLVIHRDLKPTNILVGTDGEPKLLDFGIAKLLRPEPVPATETATGLEPMTPEYASPEQIRAQPVTTASDVYALGVLLYKLLTGHLPYALDRRRAAEMRRLICEEQPPQPSVMAARPPAGDGDGDGDGDGKSRRRLARRLAGDLDTILLMALRKEPRRRYPSVEALTRDLRRHLDGLPVAARRETFGYRLSKFIRRHPRELVAVAVVLVALALFGLDRELQQRRTAAERDRAEQVSGFLKDLFADPARSPDGQTSARELLDRGARKLERELRDQPELRATLKSALASGYRDLGLLEAATPLFEEALRLRRETHDRPHPDVATSLNELAVLEVDKGRFQRAEALHREALAILAELYPDDHPRVMTTRSYVAATLMDQGRYGEAAAIFQAVLDWRLRRGDAEPMAIAALRSNLAILRYHLGDDEAAEDLLRQALAATRELEGASNPQVRSHIANLGTVLRSRGKYDESEKLHREALLIARQLHEKHHPAIAKALLNLSALLIDRGDPADADSLLAEAETIWRAVYGDDVHPDPITGLRERARLLRLAGSPEAALPLARRSLELCRRFLGENHPKTLDARLTLAMVHLDLGEHPAAERQARAARDGYRASLVAGSWRIAAAESLLGRALAGQDRLLEAEPLLRVSLEALERQKGVYDPWSRETRAAVLALSE